MGLALAYSIIGYKTPWLAVSFLIPMALLSGYAAEQVDIALTLAKLRLLWVMALVVIMILNGGLAWSVNFEKYDDNGNTSGYFSDTGRKMKLRPYLDGLVFFFSSRRRHTSCLSDWSSDVCSSD